MNNRLWPKVGLGILLCLFAAVANAQPANDRAVTGFLSLGAGIALPVSSQVTTLAVISDGDWPNTTFPPIYKHGVETTYEVTRNWLLDFNGGVLLKRGFGVGLAVSRHAGESPAEVTASLDEPGSHPILLSTKSLDGLHRTEVGVHVELVYAVPATGRLRLLLFGGPSRFSLRQDVVADVDRTLDFDLESFDPVLKVAGVESETVHASGWGFNVGADVAYFTSESMGVGALVRYGRATVGLPNLLSSTIRGRVVTGDVDAGGLQLSGGLRLRF
jgi:hypothetical protein